jgi:hypothetical protein
MCFREVLSYTGIGALRGVPAKGGGAYLLANSAVGGDAPSQKKIRGYLGGECHTRLGNFRV